MFHLTLTDAKDGTEFYETNMNMSGKKVADVLPVMLDLLYEEMIQSEDWTLDISIKKENGKRLVSLVHGGNEVYFTAINIRSMEVEEIFDYLFECWKENTGFTVKLDPL